MTNEEIEFTIKLMNGSGGDAAQSILSYLSRSDLQAFKSICEKYADGSATVDFEWDPYKGLEYFHKMTFHNIFESSVVCCNIELLDYLLKNDVIKSRIHFLKDEANWFRSLLSSWRYESNKRESNDQAVIDYLILDYGLPFNHHFKKIVESDEDYKKIGDIFKARDLARKLTKKLPAKSKPEQTKVEKI